MQKISLTAVNLNCFMQQATEISTQMCHEGIISKDQEGNLRFEENAHAQRSWDRNPHIFEGKYINMARRKDGSLKFNFKKVNSNVPGFVPDDYAFHVFTELSSALQILK